jgi:hypothetical protein
MYSEPLPEALAMERYHRVNHAAFAIANGGRTDEAMLLCLLQRGDARFEGTTGEFCFGGLRYSARDEEWSRLIKVIGPEKVRAAIKESEA